MKITAASFAFLAFMAASPAPAECPSETEVRASITRYITQDFWSPGQRDIWKITDVSGFEFGPVKFAKQQADSCSLRVEYSFRVTHADGRIEVTKKGVGETFQFGRNSFDEWVFTVGAS